MTKIFHESVVVNLIETIMFHRTAIDAADDYLLELVDYAYRNVYKLVSGKTRWIDTPKDPQELASTNRDKEFEKQSSHIDFNVAISSISIIRYISDHVKTLSPAVLRHIHLENDMLMACVALIEDRPWLKKVEGKPKEKFEDGQWMEIPKNEMSKLPKIEGQIWITIYNLLLAPECAKNYEITDYRKNMLLRLRKYLNEIIIDQIPNLTEVLKVLEQMSIMNTNAQVSSNPFVVQQIPELRRSIVEGKDWQEIADYQMENFFTKEAEAAEFDDLVKFADMYSNSNIEALSEGFKCANCLKPATQRCSRCKIVWYCSRECQVEHYKKEHKLECKKLAEKQVHKLEKRAGTESGVILNPTEVKSQTAKLNQIPQANVKESDKQPKFKVEVLNSTEQDETEATRPQAETVAQSPAQTPAEPAPVKSPEPVQQEPEEPVNVMEELD